MFFDNRVRACSVDECGASCVPFRDAELNNLAVVCAVSAVRAAVGIASCIEFRRACLADEISMEGMIPAQNERWRRG